MPSRPDEKSGVEDLFDSLVKGNRRALSRAITLVESRRPDHREQAKALLRLARSLSVRACRIGLTGAPGAGKSTLIEVLGEYLVRIGRRVAVLSVDPSSSSSGGSLLADKTRMRRLAALEGAYVRPSPSGGLLGGIARNTADAALLCEAAGFDPVIIETVGTGQSEVSVAHIVDSFVVLIVPGAGDELQGMKRGVLELADVVAVTKADGENAQPAENARIQHEIALCRLNRQRAEPTPVVLSVSALEGRGIQEIWRVVAQRHEQMTKEMIDARHADQRVAHFRERLELGLHTRFHALSRVRDRLPSIERAVRAGALEADEAVSRVLAFLT